MQLHNKNLARGGWFQLSLSEQLGNIGSDISRAILWQKKDEMIFNRSIDRSLELLDLTISDARWRGRLKELVRAREMLCDAVSGGHEYGSTLEELERYFFHFAVLARS